MFYRQYWHARVRTWAMLLFLLTLKNFDDCTVTMGVHALFSEGVYKPLVLHTAVDNTCDKMCIMICALYKYLCAVIFMKFLQSSASSYTVQR